MIERRKALTKKMEEIRQINPALRYQIRLGKSDFRLLTKNFKTTEYTTYREVAISIVDPLDEFPRPGNNSKVNINDSHARMISDAVKRAHESAAKPSDSEWNTVGKRFLSPEKLERNIRKKMNSPLKINEALQRIISGKKVLDIGDLGITDEDLSGHKLVVSQPSFNSPSAPPMEEGMVDQDEEVVRESEVQEEVTVHIDVDEAPPGIVNLGASVSGTQKQ